MRVDIEQTATSVEQRLLHRDQRVAYPHVFEEGRLLSCGRVRIRSRYPRRQNRHDLDPGQPGFHGQHASQLTSYYQRCPPATVMVSPVMNEASSESRKAMTAAVSSGSWRRPRAILERTHWPRSPPDWATVWSR